MNTTVQQHSSRSRVMAITAGVAGNILEWYDFAIYGFFAPVLVQLFFPAEDPTTSLIASFGAFAAGFLMRPVGGALFGYIGDRVGRKRALNLSVLLMAVPTFLIGLIPTHAQIGMGAAVILVFLRMLQGLSVGGEYTSSIVYLAESAPEGKRGLFTSTSMMGAIGGILLGSFLGSIITGMLTEAQLQSWGWRIPFLFGILVAGIGYLIRRHMPETLSEQEEKENPLRTLRRNWVQVVQVSGLNMLSAIFFYALFVFVVTWLVDYVEESRTLALRLNSVSLLIFMVAILFFAHLSDRIGRKRLIIPGAVAIILFGYPLFWLMHHHDETMILAGEIGLAVLAAAYMAPIPATLTEMFPKNIRVSAVSVGYNLAYAIFGGTVPMVAVWLIKKEHDDLAFVWYIIAAAVVSLIVAFSLHRQIKNQMLD
ncbi:MAG: MFS transporter [Lewinellaceae bacterium]|nr:MFS transporter [Lewinellaceae bacterium]